MGRLRARSANNTHWVDICQSDWYRRNADNTKWVPMLPSSGMYVRHGAEKYWLQIDCLADESAICGEDQYGGTTDGKGENGSGPGNNPGLGGGGIGGGGGTGGIGGGGGTGGIGGGGGTGGIGGGDMINWGDPDKGSGDGGGSGGPSVGPGGMYPPGYDLPDIGGIGGGLNSGCIFRPGLNTCETYYDNVGAGDCPGNARKGQYDCPLDCDDEARGYGTAIWEFYVKHGGEPMRMDWLADGSGASFDIYYKGKRVATTDGRVVGDGSLNFQADGGDERVFVRVRTRSNSSWFVQFHCAVADDDRGSLSNPHPCRGLFRPYFQAKKVVHYHKVGSKAGRVDINYDMFEGPDMLVVETLDGKVLATTGKAVQYIGALTFDWEPDQYGLVKVTVTANVAGNWEYSMMCPGEKGGANNPRPCDDDSAVESGGAGVTDIYINFGSIPGKVGIRYQMWYVPDQLDVYQSGSLIATTGKPVTGDHWLYFDYDPAGGTSLCVRVTGEGETTWAFLHTCPGDNTINIFTDDTRVLEGSKDQPGKLCWDVKLDKPSSVPVEVDYVTSGGNANPLTAEGKILATDEHTRPFIAGVDTPGVGRAIFDGGFPKFYNNRFTPPMTAPKGDEVFNTWPRSQGPNYYSDLASIPSGSQARSWTLDGNGDIRCTVNSSSVLTFVSPEAFDDYTFAATLYSGDSDDDTIGLVAASTVVGGVLHQIVALRQRGGNNNFAASKTFALTLISNGNVSRVLASVNIGGTGGWSGRSTRVEVRKECSKITAYCSDWNSDELSPDSELVVDLAGDPALSAIFGEKTSFGFMTYSQLGSTYRNVFLSGVGLISDFTYLKNAILWTSEGNDKGKLLAMSCAPAGRNYSMDDAANGFAISMRGMGDATDKVTDVVEFRQLTTQYLNQYDCMIFIGSNHSSGPRFNSASLGAISNFVKAGGGLVVITDHDVFQATANQIAGLFNVEFYGDIDRSPIAVSTLVERHGDHPIYDGLACKSIWAGGSEGAIRIKEIRSDYIPVAGTLVFEPGETSKEVCVDLIGNDTVDGDRTINFNLSNPRGGEITRDKGVGTIVDDDSPLCKQDPKIPVKGIAGGPHGAQLMYVQDNVNCAAGNTWYLMRSFQNFEADGPYVFNIRSDDDFQLYIDCKLVAEGRIGNTVVTVNVKKGQRNVILRYLNIPHCTPGYAGYAMTYLGQLQYVTNPSDWLGIANHVGEV